MPRQRHGQRADVISSQYPIEVKLLRDEVPSFDAYPFSLPAIRNLESLPLHPRVTLRPKDGFFLRAESFFNLATEIEHLEYEAHAGRPARPRRL